MTVVVLNRFKGTQDYRAAGVEGAAILKRHGATTVRAGRIYSGEHTGQLVVAGTYPDMAALGKSAQGLAADPAWIKFFAEFSKGYELQERSITIVEDF